MSNAKYLCSEHCVSLQEYFLNSFLQFFFAVMATRFLHGIKFFEQLWKPNNPAKFG
jgi:hypothetical protein